MPFFGPGADVRFTRTAGLAPAYALQELMFDHVKFGVSDYAASKAFFLKALEPLGLEVGGEGTPSYGVELCTKSKASLCSVPNRRETGASSPRIRGREAPASRCLPSRSPRGRCQGQWRAWSPPALPCELLRGIRHWSGRAQHRSGLPRTRGLTSIERTPSGNRQIAHRRLWLATRVGSADRRES